MTLPRYLNSCPIWIQSTCNNLIVLQRCHCFLNFTVISNIWKGVNGHSILRKKTSAYSLSGTLHGPRWCTAWIAFDCVHCTYDAWLSPKFLWSLSPLPLLLSIFSVASSTPLCPFWRHLRGSWLCHGRQTKVAIYSRFSGIGSL